MSSPLPQLLALTSLVTTAVCLALVYRSIGREISEARRETSRFPMFAARDELIDLVIHRHIGEDAPAWLNLYRGVNSILGLHRKLDALSCLRTYMRRSAEVRRNPERRKALDEMQRIENDAAERIPEFRAVRDRVVKAFDHLVARRSTVWHFTVVHSLYICAKLVLIAAQAGLGVAQGVRRSLAHPTSDDLKQWC